KTILDQRAALRNALKNLRTSHDELKATQLRLVQAAKLESIGRLAAGVAHEVKNPLAVILAGTEFLQAHPESSARETTLADIRAAVERANGVIGGLLNYASTTELRAATTDLEPVLESSLHLVQHAMTRHRVTLVREYQPGLPQISLDSTKIEQVFVNLFINAIDAMGDGGTLTIRTRRAQLTRGGKDVGVGRADSLRVGQTVVIADVLDTGPGLSDATLRRLFDPFFTTKPTGKGTGLGLATCK